MFRGSMRSNSVSSYILYVISALGYEIREISILSGEKKLKDPLQKTEIKMGKVTITSNLVDLMLLSDRLDCILSPMIQVLS